MESEKDLIMKINNIMSNRYGYWTIGITINTNTLKRKKGYPQTWYHWESNSEKAANNVVDYFIEKGCSSVKKAMELETSMDEEVFFVYIY